ncbi:S41 family peptidase [Paenibacillus sepulcri]|uniref:S41 family peptidase n=1 Tax=Paenibacillus sepulcri TaxID=359917 RepID=A0ABS7C2X0_9BACL|nr:S41 family peptidase [Paenibacillus sepulcri]
MDEGLSLERRLLIVSETFRLIEKFFIHWEDALITPNEMEQTAETFFKKAADAKTRIQFNWVRMELFGRLRNAHSWFSDQGAPEPDNGYLGFSLLNMGGQWVVDLDATGALQPGDAVLAIGGKCPSEWYRELEPFIGASKADSKQIRAQYLFSAIIPGVTLEVEIQDKNDSRRSVMLSRMKGDDKRLKTVNMPSETEGKWLQKGKTAYIRIPSFTQPIYEERALGLVNEYQHASTIVIDLRGNGGGSTPVQLTRRLMDRPYRSWMERSRHPEWLWQRHGGGNIKFADDYRYAERQPDWMQHSGEGEHYTGRIILLGDRRAGSAAEDFIMPFKDNGRAEIVGEHTWGSRGQPIIKHFGDDIQIGIGTIRAYFPSGDPFEGVGIAPDIEVGYTRGELYDKTDSALEKAMELID